MKLAINMESVMALRYLADTMPVAIDNIGHSTEHLIGVYKSVADSVGPHNNSFQQMILHVMKASIVAEEAIAIMPDMLRTTADRMERYINQSTDAGDDDTTPSIGQKVLRMRM